MEIAITVSEKLCMRVEVSQAVRVKATTIST